MRRTIYFLFSLALFGTGTYGLLEQIICILGLLDYSCRVRGVTYLASGALAILGASLLWFDFLKPWIQKRHQ